jgi:hypothetical protein
MAFCRLEMRESYLNVLMGRSVFAYMQQLKLAVVIWNYKVFALNVDCFQ